MFQTLAAAYDEALAGLPVILPPKGRPGHQHAWHLYVLRLAGLVDMEQVYIPTTYLWATALGGVGVGAGMGDPTVMGNEAAMAGAMASLLERAWSWLLDTVGKRLPVVISHIAVARIAPRVAQRIRV